MTTLWAPQQGMVGSPFAHIPGTNPPLFQLLLYAVGEKIEAASESMMEESCDINGMHKLSGNNRLDLLSYFE